MPSPPQGGALGTLPTPIGLGGQLANSGPTSPVAWWKMNETTGSTLADSAGNSLTLTGNSTIPGNVGTLPGYAVSSIIWNGSIRNASVAAYTSLLDLGSSAFSVTGWVNFTTGGVLAGTLSVPNSFQGWELNVSASVAGEITLLLINTLTTNLLQVSSNTGGSLLASTTFFIAATYDGSKTGVGVKLYINGSPVTTAINTSNLTGAITSPALFTIGSRPDSVFDTGMAGHQADTRVYTGVLSSSQISALFTAGPA